MSSNLPNPQSQRVEGLDLVRFLAFAGMVIVNFSVVTATPASPDWAWGLTEGLQGRAAASFVVLAGIGLGLAGSGPNVGGYIWTTLRRALFLLVIGLANTLIFDADILHYYAFYFLFAAMFLPLSTRWIWSGIIGLNVAAVLMMGLLDFDQGWNWATLTYHDFWTVPGFLRNLFFNGWHPVIPWLSFMLLGLVLARSALATRRFQWRLLIIGLLTWMGAEGLSVGLLEATQASDPDLAALLTTEPVPARPLYILAGSGFAMTLTAACLLLCAPLRKIGLVSLLAPAGRQTLTLYIAHILIGMGLLEEMGLINSGLDAASTLMLSLGFILTSVVYAWLWSRRFKRGPVEALMRKIAG